MEVRATTVSERDGGEQAGQLLRHSEGDGKDDGVLVLDVFLDCHGAGAGLEHGGRDSLGATDVRHLDVVTGSTELAGEIAADRSGIKVSVSPETPEGS